MKRKEMKTSSSVDPIAGAKDHAYAPANAVPFGVFCTGGVCHMDVVCILPIVSSRTCIR